MEGIESMEDVAMSGEMKERKAEKLERKRRRQLEKVKKALHLDDYYNDEPLTAQDIEESLMELLEGFKDPLTKAVLGNAVYKKSVNGIIDVITAIEKVSEKEEKGLLTKV